MNFDIHKDAYVIAKKTLVQEWIVKMVFFPPEFQTSFFDWHYEFPIEVLFNDFKGERKL